MNNVKIIYYNIDTINTKDLEQALTSDKRYNSHTVIKPGLLLVNFSGTAQDLFSVFGDNIQDQNIFIHDLDSGNNAFWGYMNKQIWDWVKANRN